MSERRDVWLWTFSLCVAWTGAWLAYLGIAARWPGLRESNAASAWWHACKLAIWLAPVLVLIGRRPRAALAWLGLDHARGLGRAVLVTLAFLVVAGTIDAMVPGQWPAPAQADRHVVWLLAIALWGPFLEELLFRGYALQRLVDGGAGFWRANLESALLFVLLHVPGWLFQGHSALECLELGARVGVLGFLFGSLRAGGASLFGSVLLHVANNAWRAGYFVSTADALSAMVRG